MALFKRGNIWWYEFLFARRRVRESAKTTSKTVAKLAEQKRRRQLEDGFNGVDDNREERIRSVKELGRAYLDDYKLRHKSGVFAEYAVGNVTRHLGATMAVDVTERTVIEYQTARLTEKAAAKTINEEVGFLLRLLGDAGDIIRTRLRRRKTLRLAVPRGPGKAYTRTKGRDARRGKGGPVPRYLPGAHVGSECRHEGCRNPRASMGTTGPV
jgi:hypothetical protein